MVKSAIALLGLIASALTGCAEQKDFPAFLINESDATARISFIYARNSGEPEGSKRKCFLGQTRDAIRMSSAQFAYRHEFRGWGAAELTDYDPEACAAKTNLQPGQALIMFWNPACSGRTKVDPGSYASPMLERLEIAGANSTLQLNGSDVLRAFKASRTHRDCRLVIR